MNIVKVGTYQRQDMLIPTSHPAVKVPTKQSTVFSILALKQSLYSCTSTIIQFNTEHEQEVTISRTFVMVSDLQVENFGKVQEEIQGQ